ncbi:MAG TPA: rhodanese-like domain-containing protein [Vicinamibacterales bacterium]|nr:rhodanese-like domain-containing protein [Vicinamibacterales bacterium]
MQRVLTVVGLAVIAVAGPVVAQRSGSAGSDAATFARPELLVETDWLAAHLSDPAIRVVDLRPRGYEDGHIPGAVHLPNAATRDAAQAPSFVPLAADFQRTMTALGITNATRVVAYDDRGGVYAARLWWLLNYYGHSNVALLNGGWTKWTLEGRTVDRSAAAGGPQPEAPSAGTAGFVARPQPRWLATAPDVVDGIGKPGVKIVDARTTGEIEGRELRGARRGGIVPSAIPVYWEDALDPNTRAFKPAPALAKLYLDRGVQPEHEVIAYCQVGMRASHDLFTLHLLGYDKLRTYLGSWDEWGNRDDLPVAVANTAKAFVGARIINGRGTPPIENATLIVENGRVTAAGPGASTSVPSGAEQIDVSGRTIVPGFINAHGHVGDTRGLKAAPEFYTEENVRAQLGLYARYGVTTVASLGGDREAGFALRDAQRTASFDLARLLVAGPVINATTPEEARAEVDKVAATKPDIIKIRVDDNLGTATKMPMAAAIAVVEQAHKHGLRAAAHIFYLEDAKALARAGVDMLAHSVRDKPVDDELIKLLKARDACVCPTLMREVSTFVYGSTPQFFSDPFFLRSADPKLLEELRDPKRQETVRTSRAAQEYAKALDVAAANLKRLADAGVRIAFGTDTGPPARFQGFFEHEELRLMVEKAGLTPTQTIKAATSDAAACLQAKGIGALEPGAWADFIVLEKNPLENIRNTRSIESVWIAGRRIAR